MAQWASVWLVYAQPNRDSAELHGFNQGDIPGKPVITNISQCMKRVQESASSRAKIMLPGLEKLIQLIGSNMVMSLTKMPEGRKSHTILSLENNKTGMRISSYIFVADKWRS
ncbi:uncharacterized protein [Palaemon carinicauda]|uniref:uncharacterized protein isoform X2 n=1 Tax=Palaemon carinicauda TaxID=392227 RepID=UPI0035B635F8